MPPEFQLRSFVKIFLSLLIFTICLLSCSDHINYLPEKVFNLKLNKRLVGDEALNFVNRLHFSNVTAEETEIGFYGSGNERAVIYVTLFENESSARKVEKEMTRKISEETSVFTRGKYIDFSNRNIYKTFGMGQTHFVFTHKSSLIWLSAGTGWANEFLSEYLIIID